MIKLVITASIAIMVSGIHNPIYIIDGIPYESNVINSLISKMDVARVSVLKNVEASINGTGYSHIIIIDSNTIQQYSFKGLYFDKREKMHYARSSIQYGYGGYYKPKTFYAPKYNQDASEKYERIDFRNTIYWNPTIQTDKYGKASISFYNSDANGSFQVKAEGVGVNATVGSSSSLYYTQDKMHAKLLLPPYLVVGDTLNLLSQTSNNSTDTLHVFSKLECPDEVEVIGQNENQSLLLPEKAQSKTTTISPVLAGNDLPITLETDYGSFHESASYAIDILDPYFHYESSFSSYKPQSYTFDIDRRGFWYYRSTGDFVY